MLKAVITEVIEALRKAGIAAGAAFPKENINRENAFLRVGVAGIVDRSAGFGSYLGIENDPETGPREIYGLRCDVDLSFDIYAPLSAENAALECAALFDLAAATVGGMAGLRVREVRCGAPGPDKDTGMFRLSGGARYEALLTVAQSGEEEAVFTDFVLRGELRQA